MTGGAVRARAVRARVSGLLTVNRVAVGVTTALAASCYGAFELIRYAHFKTSTYDLVIFYQAVRSYARFQPGISIAKGVQDGFTPHFSVLGDHFSPILAALAPLIWIHDSPATLLVAQALLFALAIIPLWLFTRRALGGGRRATAAAYLVSFGYALSWPVAAAVYFDFHEVAFAPVLTAIALERLQAGRLRGALLAIGGLLLVKEDMGLLVAGIGIYLAVCRPTVVTRQRLVAGCLIVAGVAQTWLTTRLAIPAFGGRSDFYWYYGAFGKNAPQALWDMLLHPLTALRTLITPGEKVATMALLLAPFLFLPLLSPITLAALPLIFERMLADYPRWWGTTYQYNAFLVIVLAFAGVDGAARLGRWTGLIWRRRRAVAPTFAPTFTLCCAAGMAVVAVALLPLFKFGDALHASFYASTPRYVAADGAVAAVPAGVVVEAENNLGPQLAGRDTVLLWDSKHPRWAPWVAAYVGPAYWPFPSTPAELRRVRLLRARGYSVVYSRGKYVVLHRPVPWHG